MQNQRLTFLLQLIYITSMDLQDLRVNYGKGSIQDTMLPSHPMDWFSDWLDQAILSSSIEANAMVLSTVSGDGYPSSRVVLLKAYDERGFVFFTNYESRKGKQLKDNPNASLLFFWPAMERQIRVEGTIEKTKGIESDEYFLSRPLESRISAVVSPQSQVIESREFLEERYRNFIQQQAAGTLHRPNNWGGYRLIPGLFEFWQGRKNRLHDRIQYLRLADKWVKQRLAP